MIKISGKVEKLNIYDGFQCKFSLCIEGRNSTDNIFLSSSTF